MQERQGIEITGRLGHSTIELALLLSSFNSWERTGRWSTQSRRKCWIANCFPGWIRYSHPRGSGCDREILNLSKMKLCLLRHTRSSQPESSQNISVARGAWPQKFSQHSHFVLGDAVSLTKYCYSPKLKHLGPNQVFWLLPNFWAGYAMGQNLPHLRVTWTNRNRVI